MEPRRPDGDSSRNGGCRHLRQPVAECGRCGPSAGVGAERGHQHIFEAVVHFGRYGWIGLVANSAAGSTTTGAAAPQSGGEPVNRAYKVAAREKTSPASVAGCLSRRLWRRVRRSQPHGLGGPRLSADHRRQAEVGQPRIAVPVDQDVGWFHVAVQDAAGVDSGQRFGDPDADLSNPLVTGPVLRLEPPRQGPARAEFHDEVGPVVRQDAGAVGRHDAMVIRQPARRGGLAEETASIALVQFALVHLDRDQAVQGPLASLPHHGQAASSERPPLTQARDVADAPRSTSPIAAQIAPHSQSAPG